MYNIHTHEHLDTTYCSEGVYSADAINRINYFLRCHYTNIVKPISIEVIDLLCDIKDRIGYDKRIEIISGYRSREYNEHLRNLGRHVAPGSLHLTGLAIDFAMPGIDTTRLGRTARPFAVGGVGTYPEFIHIDAGRVRHW